MTDRDDNSEQLFTRLFAHARPRARVSREHAQEIFDSLHAEWQHSLQQDRKRGWTSWAIAASIALVFIFGGALFMQTRDTNSPTQINVASLVRVAGDEVQLIAPDGTTSTAGRDGTRLVSGYGLRAGAHTRVAVDLRSGGSLRIDENTLIGFNADQSVSLTKGRIYFDSGFSPGTAPVYPLRENRFYVHTDFGEIRHIGTQFSVQTRSDHIIVTVREGEVMIVNATDRITVGAGARVIVDQNRATRTQQIAPYDPEWTWTQEIIPPPNFDNPRVAEFLSWVGRETGLQVHYVNQQARDVAETARSIGAVNETPLGALELRLRSVGLDFDLRDNQVAIRMLD